MLSLVCEVALAAGSPRALVHTTTSIQVLGQLTLSPVVHIGPKSEVPGPNMEAMSQLLGSEDH